MGVIRGLVGHGGGPRLVLFGDGLSGAGVNRRGKAGVGVGNEVGNGLVSVMLA